MSDNPVINKIWMFFYVLLAIVTGFVFVSCILGPLHYLEPKAMAIGTAVATVVFSLSCIGWHFLYDALKKRGKIKSLSVIYWILFGLLGFSVFLLLALHGNHYHIVGDYEFLYVSALETADGQPLSYPGYFLTYANNIKPMLMLSVLFKLCRIIHVDEYYPVLIVSIATFLGSVLAVGELLSDRERCKWRFPAMILMMVCLPVYVFTGVFYTDTMSFGMGVIAVALLKNAFNDDKKWFLIPAAALIATIGAGWKITALIPVIAWLVVALTYGEWQKWGRIALFAVCLTGMIAGLSVWSNSHDISKQAKTDANPTTAWIALGMTNDGSYAQGVDFSDHVNALPDKKAKSEYVSEYMKEHAKEAFSFEHIVAKTRCNFASGMFSVSDFTAQDTIGSFLWEFMDPGGKHYWRTCQFMFCYMAVIYFYGFIGCIVAAVRLGKGKDVPPVKMVADMAFFGLFVFLMIWEANNRQLYNMLPMMVTGTFLNVVVLMGSMGFKSEDAGRKSKGKKKKR